MCPLLYFIQTSFLTNPKLDIDRAVATMTNYRINDFNKNVLATKSVKSIK